MKANTSNDREESPDWLRNFQAPTSSILALSSDSEPSPNGSPSRENTITHGQQSLHEVSQLSDDEKEDIIVTKSEAHSPIKKSSKPNTLKRKLKKEDRTPIKRKTIRNNKRKEGDECKVTCVKDKPSDKHILPHASNCSVLSLSSDSESLHASSPMQEESIFPEVSSAPQKSQLLQKSKEIDAVIPDEGINDDVKVEGEEISEKRIESRALVECEGDAIDMSGDMGAVGRVVISKAPSGNNEMLLDLKGTIFKTTIVPSRTFCVVSFGQSEAKVEAIMNDFIQLTPQSNVFESETMVEGTLDGFSFDSEDETDKIPKPTGLTDDLEGAEKPTTKKAKGKTDKSTGATGRKGKAIGGKAVSKKPRKKPQVTKKTKARK